LPLASLLQAQQFAHRKLRTSFVAAVCNRKQHGGMRAPVKGGRHAASSSNSSSTITTTTKIPALYNLQDLGEGVACQTQAVAASTVLSLCCGEADTIDTTGPTVLLSTRREGDSIVGCEALGKSFVFCLPLVTARSAKHLSAHCLSIQ